MCVCVYICMCVSVRVLHILQQHIWCYSTPVVSTQGTASNVTSYVYVCVSVYVCGYSQIEGNTYIIYVKVTDHFNKSPSTINSAISSMLYYFRRGNTFPTLLYDN